MTLELLSRQRLAQLLKQYKVTTVNIQPRPAWPALPEPRTVLDALLAQAAALDQEKRKGSTDESTDTA